MLDLKQKTDQCDDMNEIDMCQVCLVWRVNDDRGDLVQWFSSYTRRNGTENNGRSESVSIFGNTHTKHVKLYKLCRHHSSSVLRNQRATSIKGKYLAL